MKSEGIVVDFIMGKGSLIFRNFLYESIDVFLNFENLQIFLRYKDIHLGLYSIL